MSTATIYADRSDEPGNPANDEATGVIGGEEPDVAALLGVQRADRPALGGGAGRG